MKTSRILLAGILALGSLTFGFPETVEAQPTNRLSLDTRAAEQGTAGVDLLVELEHTFTSGLLGFSFGLVHDPTALEVTGLDYFLGLLEPEFIEENVPQPGTPFASLGVLFSLQIPFESLPAGSYTIARATYEVLPTAPVGPSPITFGTVGSPGVQVVFSDETGFEVIPTVLEAGGIIVLEPIPAGDVENILWVPGPTNDSVTLIDPTTALSGAVATTALANPTEVVVGPNGVAWVALPGLGSIQRFVPTTSTPTAPAALAFGNEILATANPGAMAIDPLGDLWVTDASAGTVSKVSASGLPLFADAGALGPAIPLSQSPAGAAPRGLASDPIGNIWIAISGTDQLRKLDPQGATAAIVDLPAGSEPTGLAIDRLGFIWLTLRGTGRVERRGSDGSLAESFDLGAASFPEGIVIRGIEEAWVSADLPVKLVPGALPDPIDDPGTPDPTGIAIDGLGTIWTTDATGNAHHYAADGTLIEMIAVGAGAAFLGDATGIVQANILRPNDDFDGDGFANRDELDAGTNPFDELSTLPETPTVADLTCFVSVDTVTVTWSNPILYDSIEIERDGVALAGSPFPGDTTTFTDPGLTGGTFEYTVRAVIGPVPSDDVTCTAIVGPGGIASVNPIGVEVGSRATNLFDLAVHPTAPAGDPKLYATDAGSGRIYALDEDFFVLAIIDSPFQGDVPSTGIAFDPSGNGGLGSLFVASGGDASTPSRIAEITLGGVVLEPVVGGAGIVFLERSTGPLTGPIGGISIGFGSSPIVGIEPSGELIFRVERGESLLDFELTHPSAGFGLNGVAHLEPETASTASLLLTGYDPGTEEFSIDLYTLDFGGGSPSIGAASASVPLATLQEDENTFGGIAFSDDHFSVVGATTSVIYEVNAARTFIRGDANFDGAPDVADAITILAYLFGGGEDFGCLDAFDVNDDGTNNIADAITMLDFLFGGGSVVPAPGWNGMGGPAPAGFDPTSDALGCSF